MEARLKDLRDIKTVFDTFGVKFLIVYGALLGFYRDGDFLPGDDDIDLAVVEKIDFKTRKKIGQALLSIGFRPQGISVNMFGEWMEQLDAGYNGDGETGLIVCERNFKFTIFFFKEEVCSMHGREMVCTPKVGAVKLISSPARFYDHAPGQIKIGKCKYDCPSPIKDYLASTYFNNWKDKTDRRHGLTYPSQHIKQND